MWIHLFLMGLAIFGAFYLWRLRDNIEWALQEFNTMEVRSPLTKLQRRVRLFGRVSKVVITVLIAANCLIAAMFLGAVVRAL